MGRFKCHLELSLYDNLDGDAVLRDGRCQWFVREALSYETRAGETITIPAWDGTPPTSLEFTAALKAGFVFLTDLASIPPGVRTILPPDGPWVKAAVIHDYLYATKGLTDPNVGTRHFTREEADDILREAMEELGVPAWKRQIIWAAVRTFGAHGWGH